MASTTLKITSVPAGEAPAGVRGQWVGLSLPLAQPCAHAHIRLTTGVLSRPVSRVGRFIALLLGKYRREPGYLVESLIAIQTLAQSSPEAADWWRSNAAYLLQPGQYFLFQEGTAQVVSGAP